MQQVIFLFPISSKYTEKQKRYNEINICSTSKISRFSEGSDNSGGFRAWVRDAVLYYSLTLRCVYTIIYYIRNIRVLLVPVTNDGHYKTSNRASKSSEQVY